MAQDPKEMRAIWGEVVAKAWEDSSYRGAFLKDPKKVLTEAGMEIAPNVKIVALEDGPDLRHVVLPYDTPFGSYKDAVVGLLDKVLPLPEGLRVELVQNTADTRYWIMPTKPAGFTARGELSDEELALVAGGKSVNYGETVNVYHAVNVSEAVSAAVYVAGAVNTVVAVAVIVLL